MGSACGIIGSGTKTVKLHHLIKAPENTSESIKIRESWDANKPVIVYDKPSYITGIINYPPEIMSYSVNDLINKLEKIQDNFNYYNSLLNSFRKQHYTKFNLKRCQNNLIKVLR